MKKILLLRSVSGAGKSFFAETLKNLSPNKVAIVSADDFFMVTGEYVFDASKLHIAHRRCQNDFEMAVDDPNIQLVIVANTNTKEKDFAFYRDFAAERDIPIIYSVIENRRGGENIHNVPAETLDRQANSIRMSLCL